MKDFISIIIPMYNAEKYIGKLLQTLKKQTYKKIEIIIINDGSTDNSLNIVKSYEKYDKRIKVITVKNAGVGNARNIGIQKATGEYITFLDADDYIDFDMYEKIMQKIKQTNTKLLRCNFIKEDEEGNLIQANNSLKELANKLLDKNEIIDKLLYYIFDDKIPTYTCLLFARTDLIKGKYKFRTDIKMMEDLIFCLNLYTNVEQMYLYDLKCYHYVRYETSSTKARKNLIRNYNDTLKVISILEEILVENNILEKFITKVYATYSTILIKYIVRTLQKEDEYKISNIEMKELLKDTPALDIIKKADFTQCNNNCIIQMANYIKKEQFDIAYEYGMKINSEI